MMAALHHLQTTGYISLLSFSYNEYVDYDFATNTCQPSPAQCGHYTQNVCSTTTHVVTDTLVITVTHSFTHQSFPDCFTNRSTDVRSHEKECEEDEGEEYFATEKEEEEEEEFEEKQYIQKICFSE